MYRKRVLISDSASFKDAILDKGLLMVSRICNIAKGTCLQIIQAGTKGNEMCNKMGL